MGRECGDCRTYYTHRQDDRNLDDFFAEVIENSHAARRPPVAML